MKNRRKSFKRKLWSCFILFAAVILAALWLLQTVFLDRFYSGMAVANLNRAAREIIASKDGEELLSRIGAAAMKHSLLIFLTDESGAVLYSVDEYSTLYGAAEDESGGGNPYRADRSSMSWQQGAVRNLPNSHMELIERLLSSGGSSVGYAAPDGGAYVYAARLGACGAFPGKDVILCISMPLGSVGAATGILRLQLAWVSVLSFVLAFALAFLLARRFERPVRALALQAARIPQGEFGAVEKSGFCTELDDLAQTLNDTARSLERLENSRRDLLAGVSHDLRTPLTMMKGYAEMLQEFSWRDEQTRNHDLAVIQREADRLTALVNEILEFSSMQANGAQPRMESFDLSEAAECAADRFNALWNAQGYAIERSIEPGLRVLGDRGQLERVVYNLIDNAVSHAGEQKRIDIRLGARGGCVRFSVRDFGPGIPEAEIPYIWDKYYTARNRKNQNAVSGLGLSIAKEILSAHGARFGVACEEGCEFWFEMPAQAENPPE